MSAPLLDHKPLTPQQLKVLELYCRLGSQKKVAHELNLSLPTVKGHLGALYLRLGVGGAVEALNALGWIKSPLTTGVNPCGWIAYCSRADGHRGNHGGFRPFIKLSDEEMEWRNGRLEERKSLV